MSEEVFPDWGGDGIAVAGAVEEVEDVVEAVAHGENVVDGGIHRCCGIDGGAWEKGFFKKLKNREGRSGFR